MRLDKFLADCECGTRSEVKRIIRAGHVTVNGIAVKQADFSVAEAADSVCLDQKRLIYEPFSYFLFYKPAGCVTANSDRTHTTVMDYIHETAKGLFPVGRLDLDTEGLLLITNDGALSHHLLSPAHHVEKTYEVLTDTPVPEHAVSLFAEGVDIGDDKLTLPARLICENDLPAAIEKPDFVTAEAVYPAQLTICEGRFHQVRRMFEAVGCRVVYLKRSRMGSLTLDGLSPGEYRRLGAEELRRLSEA